MKLKILKKKVNTFWYNECLMTKESHCIYIIYLLKQAMLITVED